MPRPAPLAFGLLISVLVPLALSPDATAEAEEAAGAAAEAPAEWTPLFNGRDLEGWTPKIKGYPLGENHANTFRVEDGLLKVRYDQYEGDFRGRFGHLFYKAPASRYRLRLEYRFVGEQAPGGPAWAHINSGVMIHGQAPETMALDQDFPVSIEVQLLGGKGDGLPRATANVCTPGTHVVMDGQRVPAHCTPSKSPTFDGDQWVRLELEVRGNELIQHRVNGELVLEYSAPQLDDQDATARAVLASGAEVQLSGGTLSLQSESHPVDFRRVELLSLEK